MEKKIRLIKMGKKVINAYIGTGLFVSCRIGIGNISTSIYSLFNKEFQLDNIFFSKCNKTKKYQKKLVNFTIRTFILCPMKMCLYGIFSPIIIPYTIAGFIDDPKKQFTKTFTPGSDWHTI